ncbi:anion permease, partial [Staphylococcus aureus]|uniref:anion permease n=1 Tax=Staphylococcus aureus TaxID=1280 RepID=UPI001CD0C854
PAPSSLPIMAKAVLAILAFAVIMWVTEAVSYPVSATLIIGLMNAMNKMTTLYAKKSPNNVIVIFKSE